MTITNGFHHILDPMLVKMHGCQLRPSMASSPLTRDLAME